MSDDKRACDPRHETMIAALAEGMTWEEAADRVGVSDRTLRRWCASDPGLAALAAKARDAADDMVEAVTFRNCLDPNPAHNTLRMFWLKSRRPRVYRDTVRQELSSPGPLAPITIIEVRQPAPMSADVPELAE